MNKTLIFVLILVYPALGASQIKNSSETNACDEKLTLCWSADEVEAWGYSWISQDPTEKPLETSSEVRCIKRLGICAKAVAQIEPIGHRIVTKVDILPVTHWDTQQITAEGELNSADPCEKDTYILNRLDRTVLMITSPGPKSDTPGCMYFMGKPKTVVYKLSQ
jgi:hypothetical protein